MNDKGKNTKALKFLIKGLNIWIKMIILNSLGKNEMKRKIKTYEELPAQMPVLPVFRTITEGNQWDI